MKTQNLFRHYYVEQATPQRHAGVTRGSMNGVRHGGGKAGNAGCDEGGALTGVDGELARRHRRREVAGAGQFRTVRAPVCRFVTAQM